MFLIVLPRPDKRRLTLRRVSGYKNIIIRNQMSLNLASMFDSEKQIPYQTS